MRLSFREHGAEYEALAAEPRISRLRRSYPLGRGTGRLGRSARRWRRGGARHRHDTDVKMEAFAVDVQNDIAHAGASMSRARESGSSAAVKRAATPPARHTLFGDLPRFVLFSASQPMVPWFCHQPTDANWRDFGKGALVIVDLVKRHVGAAGAWKPMETAALPPGFSVPEHEPVRRAAPRRTRGGASTSNATAELAGRRTREKANAP